MVIHFRFHHFFDRTAEQVFEGILDILCGFDVVLLQELADDIAFSFGHLDFVYRFLLFCHDKRPPMIFYFTIDDLFLQKKFHRLDSFYPINEDELPFF